MEAESKPFTGAFVYHQYRPKDLSRRESPETVGNSVVFSYRQIRRPSTLQEFGLECQHRCLSRCPRLASRRTDGCTLSNDVFPRKQFLSFRCELEGVFLRSFSSAWIGGIYAPPQGTQLGAGHHQTRDERPPRARYGPRLL